jgi:transposase-like protein
VGVAEEPGDVTPSDRSIHKGPGHKAPMLVKYLNMIEQDHRFIKKLSRPMRGFKSF